MKLLLDQNISHKVVSHLKSHFENVNSIRDFGLTDANDYRIWEFARDKSFTIVTFDEDFYNIQLIKGFPPKLIWFKTGNLSKNQFTDFLIAHKEMIKAFVTNEAYSREGCLELFLIPK